MTESLSFSPTSLDREALERLIDLVPPHWKGAPLGAAVSLREFGGSRTDALSGALPFPLLLIREAALAHNLSRMARFAADRGALLAPHAKTTMSPELIARQVQAGCWAVTAATPSQLATLRRLGVQRILLANQLTEPGTIKWLATQLASDPRLEAICLVDSTEGVALLDRELRAGGIPRPVSVMLEIGVPGGRSGVRGREEAREVAAAALAAPALRLVGVECFEGLAMAPDRIPETLAAVDAHLDAVMAIASDLDQAGLLAERIVSAGGSAFFDRVVERVARPEWRLVLRSGCYVSQDGGFYDQVSPLAGRGTDSEPLRDALELWGVVLSRPEPGLVVVGAGKRDGPFDVTPPRPVAWRSPDGERAGVLSAAPPARLYDQHATFSVAARDGPLVGDLVRFALSHPCGAFDRWQVIPLVDGEDRVVAAVHTRF